MGTCRHKTGQCREGDNCQTLENGQGRIWVVGEYGFLRHANLEIPLCSHILGKPSLDLEGEIL